MLGEKVPPKTVGKSEVGLSILERIKVDAARYASKEEAVAIAEKLKILVNFPVFTHDIRDLFEVELKFPSSPVPNDVGIGEWLERNDRDERYFARTTMKQEKYQRRVPNWSAGLGVATISRFLDPEYQGYTLVNDVRSVISGFRQTNKIEYEYISIHMKPKFANIKPSECLIVPVFSLTSLRLFWSFVQFKSVDWGGWERSNPTAWKTMECEIKKQFELEKIVRVILESFGEFFESPIKAKWLPEIDSDGAQQESKLSS